MSLKIAQGVKLPREIALWAMCAAVHEAFHAAGRDTTITGGTEGVHTRGSEHYVGHALDWRTRDLPLEVAQQIRDDIAARLGADFDVILEAAPAHLHTEWDPK